MWYTLFLCALKRTPQKSMEVYLFIKIVTEAGLAMKHESEQGSWGQLVKECQIFT